MRIVEPIPFHYRIKLACCGCRRTRQACQGSKAHQRVPPSEPITLQISCLLFLSYCTSANLIHKVSSVGNQPLLAMFSSQAHIPVTRNQLPPLSNRRSPLVMIFSLLFTTLFILPRHLHFLLSLVEIYILFLSIVVLFQRSFREQCSQTFIRIRPGALLKFPHYHLYKISKPRYCTHTSNLTSHQTSSTSI